ncbi:hypothetical protein NLG97_g8491 [Lecanicillium saksenae]|uniref:Uncharacterized protein n=1 Tax=Lecanicillium saksenae TaxID=468837 RepID=A0ACC1QIR5_9HYPO|nr:hypothetical protein NLG97_g8491 [Lecanicillium saksenae]
MNTLPADVRYSHLKWNCPLSESAAHRLLEKLELDSSTDIVDIGCGWGELLLRAAYKSGASATGIDTDDALLERGRASIAAHHTQVRLENMPGNEWERVCSRAICIGSSHAFGGTKQMLERLARIVPKGRVLIGDMCWERPPSRECLDMFGDEVLQLKDIVALCREAGWKVVHLETATQQDWDAFESGHRAGPREWLLKNGEDGRAASVEEDLARKEDAYFGVYRGQLGFVLAALARS